MANVYNVKERNPYRKAMKFLPQTMMDVISWLGPQFVAITAGETIGVPIGTDGKEISITGNDRPEACVNEKLTLVMRDKVRGCIVIAKPGQFIVVGDTYGIEVYNGDTIELVYDFIDDKANASAEETTAEVPPPEFRA